MKSKIFHTEWRTLYFCTYELLDGHLSRKEMRNARPFADDECQHFGHY